jgi:DNA-binding LacI/PurR family transcriptional regulator
MIGLSWQVECAPLATIKDVAKRAGVAISTVSAVLNRSAPVSEETIGKVQLAVAEIGYMPHGVAQSLRSGRSRLIGLVVPNIANPHFAAVAREVENVCLAAGYTTVVYSTGQDSARESQVLKMMRMQRVAGLIVIPTRSDAARGAQLAGQIHVPTILLDMYVEGLPYHVIKTDNVEAGRLAADHLLSLGHRRIGIIVGIPGLATSDDRHAGYLKAHAEHGVPVDPTLAVIGAFDQRRAHDVALGLLGRPDRPTAMLAISNMMMLGLLFAIKELRLAIPDYVSVVGIDDLEFAGLLDPRPSAVATPILVMARRAIEALLAQIANPAPIEGPWEVHQPSLIVRESAAAPRPVAALAD